MPPFPQKPVPKSKPVVVTAKAVAVVFVEGRERCIMVDSEGKLPEAAYRIGDCPREALMKIHGRIGFRQSLATLHTDNRTSVFWCHIGPNPHNLPEGYRFIDRMDESDMSQLSPMDRSIVDQICKALNKQRGFKPPTK